jgi:hypothetical protein
LKKSRLEPRVQFNCVTVAIDGADGNDTLFGMTLHPVGECGGKELGEFAGGLAVSHEDPEESHVILNVDFERSLCHGFRSRLWRKIRQTNAAVHAMAPTALALRAASYCPNIPCGKTLWVSPPKKKPHTGARI